MVWSLHKIDLADGGDGGGRIGVGWDGRTRPGYRSLCPPLVLASGSGSADRTRHDRHGRDHPPVAPVRTLLLPDGRLGPGWLPEPRRGRPAAWPGLAARRPSLSDRHGWDLDSVTPARHHSDMIVLHAGWVAPVGRLALWAEDGRRPRMAPARRGRPPRQPRPRPHPFALDADGIRLAVTELGGLSIGGPEGSGGMQLVLRLPDAGGGPVGSPWLDDQPADPSSEPGASAEPTVWTVPGLIVEWAESLDVLSALMAVGGDTAGQSTTDEAGVALAADFRFAARAAEMVLELITRGRVLPSLEHGTDGWQARWRPLIDAC